MNYVNDIRQLPINNDYQLKSNMYLQWVGSGFDSIKEDLKIPKGQSESVNRRTDNTTAKKKTAKGQTTLYKTMHRKLKNRAT